MSGDSSRKDSFLNHVFGTLTYCAKRIRDIIIPVFPRGAKSRQLQHDAIASYLTDPEHRPVDAVNAAFYVFQQVLEEDHEMEEIQGPIAFYCPVRFKHPPKIVHKGCASAARWARRYATGFDNLVTLPIPFSKPLPWGFGSLLDIVPIGGAFAELSISFTFFCRMFAMTGVDRKTAVRSAWPLALEGVGSAIPGCNFIMALVFPNIRMAHQVECRAIFMDLFLSAKQMTGEDGKIYWQSERMAEYFTSPVVYSQAIRDHFCPHP